MKYQTSFKYCFLMALVLLIAASSVYATETRVSSMGGIGFYTNDNSNIFFFPGTIYKYKGQIVGELRSRGDDNSYTVGVQYPWAKDKVLGVYLNRPISYAIPVGVAPDVALNYTSDVLFGMQMTNFDLGLRVSLGFDGYTSPDTGILKIDESARYFAVAAGISNEKMDVGLLLDMPSAKWERDTLSRKWSGTGFGANARYFYGEQTKLVPLVTFYTSSTSTKDTPNPTPSSQIDYSRLNFGIGVGVNRQINDNNLFVLGLEVLGISKIKEEPKDTLQDGFENTARTLPALYMGVESKIRPWLIGRIGAAQVFQKITEKQTGPAFPGRSRERSFDESNFNVSFGLGLNFGSFALDASINERMFFDGPYIISGYSNVLANRLSITYSF